MIQTMCLGSPSSPSSTNNMSNHLTIETEDSFSSLLELAANDDLDAFKRSAERDPSAVDEVGLWYGRKKGCNQMVLQQRTPLMVAATYGSIDVLSYILEFGVDVNRICGEDKTSALHCAASGGSEHAVAAVKILLSGGADLSLEDVDGFKPGDVIVVAPRLLKAKVALEELLGGSSVKNGGDGDYHWNLRVDTTSKESLQEDGDSPRLGIRSSPLPERKEYPVDPSLPDIKNSIYATDEFRMFSFKVRPCSRAYSHDWTECPFVHPGENARRRDPRKYHYSCVPCPDFRKGACRRGDLCEYAHGVFECWLHPAQYRTKLCKDGTTCNRRVCFFAHTDEELRPLYMSTGSAVPSPRSSASAAMEMAVAMGLMPGSPSSVSAVMSPFTPPMSPSNGLNWPQNNLPALHLPGNSLQSSRLRSSLSARDMPLDDYSMIQEFEAQQLMNDLRMSARSKTMTPSNLEDLFSSEIYPEQGAMFSPSHKSTILNQFQQQQQSLLSPINTNVFSPPHKSTISSPGRMSPRAMDPISPMSSRLSAIAQREKQTLRSLSSRDLGSGSSAISASWSKWGSPSGTADWGVNGEELGRLKRSSSFELRSAGEEPDLSWVHSLVKESPQEKPVSAPNGEADEDQTAALGAWLDQMQMDDMVKNSK